MIRRDQYVTVLMNLPHAPTMTTSPPTTVLTAAPRTDTGLLRAIGIFTLLIFIFLDVSRIMDISFYYLHVPLISSVATLFVALFSGCWVNSVKTRVGRLYGVMAVLLVAGTPFSLWRSGSLAVITHSWLRSVLVSMLVLSLAITYKDCVYTMNAIACAVLLAAVSGLRAGTLSMDGRLAVGRYGDLANPNYFAFVLMLGVPLWWCYMSCGGPGVGRIIRCVIGAGATVTILACFLRTGSRGGLIALIVMLFIAFLRASITSKAILLVALTVGACVVVVALPKTMRDRYFMVFSVHTGDFSTMDVVRMSDMATSSSEQRLHLLLASLKVTLQHPLFGVGPGNFTGAENTMAVDAGLRKGAWRGTHNTYTQLSSECGIPVLIVFLVLLGGSIRSLSSVRKRVAEDARPIAADIGRSALAVEMLLWGSSVFMLFAHVGYDVPIYLLLSVAAVLVRAANGELAVAAPAPGPALTPVLVGYPVLRRVAAR